MFLSREEVRNFFLKGWIVSISDFQGIRLMSQNSTLIHNGREGGKKEGRKEGGRREDSANEQ